MCRHHECRLAYVVDSNETMAEYYGARWSAQWTTSIDEVLEDDSVRGIWVSTPTHTHMDIILKSLQAGKAVMVEKPVAATVEEINQCYDAAEEAGVPLLCSFQRRFDPSYVNLRGAVLAGKIGTPQSGHCVFRDHPVPPVEFLIEGGDIFHDLICHDSDYIAWVLGEQPVGVMAQGSSHIPELKELGIYDAATVVLEYPSGVIW